VERRVRYATLAYVNAHIFGTLRLTERADKRTIRL